MKRILRYGFVAVLTIVFLALFLRRSDPRSVLSLLGSTNVGWLVLAVSADVGALFFRAFRWRLLLDPDDPPPLYSTFFATAVGYTISMLLPVRAADVARPALISRRTKIRFSTALGTILTERVLDLCSMLTFFMLFVVRYVPHFRSDPSMRGKVIALQTAASISVVLVSLNVALLLLVYFFSSRIRVFHEFLGRILPRRVRESWMRVFDSFVSTVRVVHKGSAFLGILLFTLGIWLCLGLQFYFVLYAFQRPLPFLASFLVTAMAIIGLIIPTPAGVGGYHKASQIALTSFFHFDVNTSVAVAVVFHLVGVVPMLIIGSILFIREGMTWKSVSRIAESERAPEDPLEIGETRQE